MTKRAFGRGTAVAIAVMVTTLPMMAEADSGTEVPSGPWVGADHRLPRFQYRTRWVNPDSAPGRWGGYRGNLQPPGVEPPAAGPGDPDRTTDPRAAEPASAPPPTGTAEL